MKSCTGRVNSFAGTVHYMIPSGENDLISLTASVCELFAALIISTASRALIFRPFFDCVVGVRLIIMIIGIADQN